MYVWKIGERILKSFSSATEANDWLRSEKNKKKFRSLIDDNGKVVAKINSSGEEDFFVPETAKPIEITPAKEIKTPEIPAKKVVPSREEIFEHCDEYDEEEAPVQKIEETVEAAPEKIEEETEMNENLVSVLGKINELAGKATQMALTVSSVAAAPVAAPVVEDTTKIAALEAKIEKITNSAKAKIDELKATIETERKTAATWQSKATKAEAEKASAVANWHDAASKLAAAEQRIAELEDEMKSATPRKRVYRVKKSVKTSAPVAVASAVVAPVVPAIDDEKLPWDDDETSVETHVKTEPDPEYEEEDERSQYFINGVPFMWGGKCCLAWTKQEIALLNEADQNEILNKICQVAEHHREGEPTLAERFGITRLVREENYKKELGEVHDREWELIWDGPVGTITLPEFKYKHSVDVSTLQAYGKLPGDPITLAYTHDQYNAASCEQQSLMKIDQRAIDETGDVKQISYTTLSDGRIAFRKKDGSIAYDWYWDIKDFFANSGYTKDVMKQSSAAGNQCAKFQAMMAHATNPKCLYDLLDNLEDCDADRAFLRFYIDHCDIRVKRPYKFNRRINAVEEVEFLSFDSYWDALMYEHEYDASVCTDTISSAEEALRAQAGFLGSSRKELWIELAKHIDDAKQRLHIADYAGKAK